MIITETFTIKDKEFIKTYSDSGFMIERDGVRYAEANDPAEFNRQYIETDEPIESPEEERIEDEIESESEPEPIEDIDELREKARAYDVLMGMAD